MSALTPLRHRGGLLYSALSALTPLRHRGGLLYSALSALTPLRHRGGLLYSALSALTPLRHRGGLLYIVPCQHLLHCGTAVVNKTNLRLITYEIKCNVFCNYIYISFIFSSNIALRIILTNHTCYFLFCYHYDIHL